MPVHPFLRSPAFLSGAGVLGSGAVSVGGWQIYDGIYPTVNRKLYEGGYRFSPIQSPNEDRPLDAKFAWNSWECFKKLFPEVEVKHIDASSQLDALPAGSEGEITSKGNFISCAIMELRPWSFEDDKNDRTKNRIYFKSELVIKGENIGWVLWTGLSTVPTKNQDGTYNNSSDFLDFVYRLIFLKKDEGGKWKIDSGYRWNNYTTQPPTGQKLFISSPEEVWLNGRVYTDSSPFKERKWAGIGEVDSYYSSKEVFQSMPAYVDQLEDAEILGNDGTFSVSSSDTKVPGYESVQYFYVDNEGWKFVKGGVSPRSLNLKQTLVKWYGPLKGKKVSWTEMSRRCSSWSRSRNLNAPFSNEFTSLCYSSPPTAQ